ncbi:MAG: cytochrome P450 [Verrucomicrobiae bacterium]|nr:cytochrome P450 [Verrucomicrobiae bacterium]
MPSFADIPHYDSLGLTNGNKPQELEQFDHLTAYKKFGPIYRVSFRGEDWACVGGLQANEWAWGHPDRWNYSDPMKGFREVMGPTHVTQLDGPVHRAKRKALKPGFAMSLIARQIPVIDAVIKQFFTDQCREKWTMMNLFMEALTEANSKTVLKVDLSPEARRAFIEFEEVFLPGIVMTEERRREYYAQSSYPRLKPFVFEFLRKVVEGRLNGHREEDNFQTMIDDRDERPSPPEIEEWIPEAYLLLMAGTGNTARTLNCGLRYFQDMPEWYAELQEELKDYQPEQLLRGMDDFPKLKASLMEMERIFPAAPVHPRLTAEDLEFEGFELPKGTRILHLHTLTHFLDEIYEDPFAFNPRRWIENDYPKKAHGTFGGSTHICLGMNLARIHMPIVMANLIRYFDLEVLELPKIGVNFNYGVPQFSDLVGRLHLKATN